MAAIVATHIFFFWTVRGRIARGDPDFTAFYTAGRILWEAKGDKLYDPATQEAVQREFTADSDIRRGPLPYIHPPFEAPLFVPLSLLPYVDAFVVWNLLNFVLLFGVCWMFRSSLVSFHTVSTAELMLACLALFPVFANFHQGQDAIVLLLLFTLAFRALSTKADAAAGCWLGLGLFRYHLALASLVILLLWGRKRALLGFVGVAVAEFFVSVGIVGWHGILSYPEYVWRWASGPGVGRTPASLMPSLYGLLSGWSWLEGFGWALRVAVLAFSAAMLVWVWRMRSFGNDRRYWNLGFAILVVVTVLIAYNSSGYDLALLVLPLALVADHCLLKLRDNRAAIAALLVPAIPLVISPLWFFLWLRWQKINLLALFLIWWAWAIWAEIRRMSRLAAVFPSA